MNDNRAKKIILAQLLIRDAAQEQRLDKLVGWLHPSLQTVTWQNKKPHQQIPLSIIAIYVCLPFLCCAQRTNSCPASSPDGSSTCWPPHGEQMHRASPQPAWSWKVQIQGNKLKKKKKPTEHVQASQAQQHRNYPLIIDTKSSFSDQSSEVWASL